MLKAPKNHKKGPGHYIHIPYPGMPLDEFGTELHQHAKGLIEPFVRYDDSGSLYVGGWVPKTQAEIARDDARRKQARIAAKKRRKDATVKKTAKELAQIKKLAEKHGLKVVTK